MQMTKKATVNLPDGERISCGSLGMTTMFPYGDRAAVYAHDTGEIEVADDERQYADDNHYSPSEAREFAAALLAAADAVDAHDTPI